MYVLGISAFSHDSAAALIKDGRVRFLLEEERLNRIKYTTAFPELAIRECLRLEGIGIEQVEHFAFYNRPVLELWGGLRHGMRYLPRSLFLFLGTHGGDGGEPGLSFMQRVKSFYRVPETLRTRFALRRAPRVHFVEHHLAHGASAFYLSGQERAAVLTWDGRGEYACTVGALGEGRKISRLFQTDIPHSLGHFYSIITDYLGFRPFADEWKVMGMSAYGEKTYVKKIQELIFLGEEGRYELDLDHFSFQYYGRKRFLSGKFYAAFGPRRAEDEPLTQRHFDLAHAAQCALEMAGLHIARHLRGVSRASRLCMTGGVAQNILLNSRVVEDSGFDEVFVQPVATDSGAALGAALQVAQAVQGFEPGPVINHVYWGPPYAEREIENALAESGLSYSRPTDLCGSVAAALAAGRIVGWFQGAMEAGPRALGNRSLLASPCLREMKEKLNLRIKRREGFRPFAPAVLEERASEFFEKLHPTLSQFMVSSAQVRPEVRDKIPAVVHVDGSARPQTVAKAVNPLFWSLIDQFGQLTGIPVLLNTSFNENEPIVCSPRDALRTYLRTEIDCLAIGPFLLTKMPQD